MFNQNPRKKGLAMKTKMILSMLLAALFMAGSGCALLVIGAAAGAGAGTVVWVKGELKSTENVSLDRASRAALKAMADLGYGVGEKQQDRTSLTLTAYGAGDKKIHVALEETSANITEIRIRVNTFGDEALSRQILEKIRANY
jgi:type IV secretory pathway TrbL component